MEEIGEREDLSKPPEVYDILASGFGQACNERLERRFFDSLAFVQSNFDRQDYNALLEKAAGKSPSSKVRLVDELIYARYLQAAAPRLGRQEVERQAAGLTAQDLSVKAEEAKRFLQAESAGALPAAAETKRTYSQRAADLVTSGQMRMRFLQLFGY